MMWFCPCEWPWIVSFRTFLWLRNNVSWSRCQRKKRSCLQLSFSISSSCVSNVQTAQVYSSPNRNNLHQTLPWRRRKELCEEGGTMELGVASPLGQWTGTASLLAWDLWARGITEQSYQMLLMPMMQPLWSVCKMRTHPDSPMPSMYKCMYYLLTSALF